jgi:hypothetical protein
MKTKDRHSGIAGAQGLAKESSADRALPVLKGVEHRFVDDEPGVVVAQALDFFTP